MQKVEIITGRERRRRWSPEEKARLVAEAFAPGSIVSHVAFPMWRGAMVLPRAAYTLGASS